MTTLAIIHPTHLVAAELREALDRRRELWQRLELLSTSDDEIGTLTEVRGEAAVVTAASQEALDGVDVVFFFGPYSSYESLLPGLSEQTTAVLMSEDPTTAQGLPIIGNLNLEQISESSTLSSPHPAALALTLFLSPLATLGLNGLAVTVLQPVSMYGNRGLDELLDQTRNLLSFQSSQEEGVLPPETAFNLLPQGAETAGIVGPLRTLLTRAGADDFDITLQLLQASVFHGFGLSVHLRLTEDPGFDALCERLDKSPWIDLDTHPARLGPKEAVAKEQLLVGTPIDQGDGRYSFWVCFDNLTIAGAMNAVALLEALSGQGERH